MTNVPGFVPQWGGYNGTNPGTIALILRKVAFLFAKARRRLNLKNQKKNWMVGHLEKNATAKF